MHEGGLDLLAGQLGRDNGRPRDTCHNCADRGGRPRKEMRYVEHRSEN